MNNKKNIFIPVLSIMISTILFFQCTSQKEIHTLIITGQNNHNWEVSTPVMQKLLDQSGLFITDIAQTPAKGEDMSSFLPDFSNYDLVVLDYSGDYWPEETKKSFVEFVSSGGGVVVYHAANNAFPDWKEYNEITGLGGWGNRDEKSGPYLRWKDGKAVKDNSPGRGGSHGPSHEFLIITRDMEHPITKGLPEKWIHAEDELYSELRGPALNLHVLSTAYADTAKGGTGEHEPLLFTIEYGEGNIFHTALGHAGGSESTSPAMQCVGFITTFLRGAEWAATGKVTQEIPEDFPTLFESHIWKDYKPLELSQILELIASYNKGDNRQYLQDLSYYIIRKGNDKNALTEIEDKLIVFLGSGASTDSKAFVCREISVIGTAKAVPVLNNLLKDDSTAEMAKFALDRIEK